MPRELDQEAALAAIQGLRSREAVATFFGVSLHRFDYNVYVRPPAYRSFTIPKRTGGRRTIHAPAEPISIWQRILASHLRDAYRAKPGVTAFCLDGGVTRNAEMHVGARLVLNLDLRDFFGAITFARVFGLMKSKPFDLPPNTAAMLAQLCCLRKALPQGAPSSPIVSNWICRSLDRRLGGLARATRCTYSRYADDITFSTKRRHFSTDILLSADPHALDLGQALRDAIISNGFEVNEKKVWLRTRRERQGVTGLVVNSRLNVRREYRRELRALLHDWEANGLGHAQGRFEHLFDGWQRDPTSRPSLVDHAAGKLQFLRQVRGSNDALFLRLAIQYERLRRRDGDQAEPRPVVLAGPAAHRQDLLAEALWVVGVRRKSDGQILQNGTAFTLHQVGVVTNLHVLEITRQELKEHETTRRGIELVGRTAVDPPGAWQRVKVLRSSAHLDLAVVGVGSASLAALTATTGEPGLGSAVTLAGFPNWHPGDSPRIEASRLTSASVRAGVRWLEIDRKIPKGNSGGPLLDAQGRVIGVASQGEDGHPVPNAAVSLHHVSDPDVK